MKFVFAILFNLISGHDDEKKDFHPTDENECDDGVTGAEVDLPIDCRTPDTWDTCPEWTCEAEKWGKIGYAAGASATMDKYDPPRPDQDVGGHKCINDNTTDLYPKSGYPNGIPSSGYHRPKWPMYGEYRWVPPIRYIHVLEHGAIAFLYHPCTPDSLVDKLRKLANGCLWKHLLFAFKGDLTAKFPIAILSYAHVLKINDINKKNVLHIKDWVKSKAKIGANQEGRVFGDGAYNLTLVENSQIVTEYEDSEICPDPKIIQTVAPIDMKAVLSDSANVAVSQTIAPTDPAIIISEINEKKETPVILPSEEEPEPEIEATTQIDYIENVPSLADSIPERTVSTSVLEQKEHAELTDDIPENLHKENIEHDVGPTFATTLETTTIAEYSKQFTLTTAFVIENSDPLEEMGDHEELSLIEATTRDLLQRVNDTHEPVWAFISLSVLIVGLLLAIYRSKLFSRASKSHNIELNKDWNDEEASISVGTLVRGFRRRSKDEASYSLLKTEEDGM